MRVVLALVVCSVALSAQTDKPATTKAVKPQTKSTKKAAAVKPGVAKPSAPKPGSKTPDAAKQSTEPQAVVSAAKIDPKLTPVEPKPKSETLQFNVNWPSGLSLGEGQLSSTLSGGKWSFTFKAEAAVPGFAIVESAQSQASDKFCSVRFAKQSTRGKRLTEEETTFDGAELKATRTTLKGGGKSEMKTSSCARDALTFLHFVRRELAAGRLPASQPVYYGGPYQARVQYTGTQSIRMGQETIEADRLLANIKGAATTLEIELLFARDAARTPLMVHIPISMGKFTVEFVR